MHSNPCDATMIYKTISCPRFILPSKVRPAGLLMLFRLRVAELPVRARVRHQVPAPACGGSSVVASGGPPTYGGFFWDQGGVGNASPRFGG